MADSLEVINNGASTSGTTEEKVTGESIEEMAATAAEVEEAVAKAENPDNEDGETNDDGKNATISGDEATIPSADDEQEGGPTAPKTEDAPFAPPPQDLPSDVASMLPPLDPQISRDSTSLASLSHDDSSSPPPPPLQHPPEEHSPKLFPTNTTAVGIDGQEYDNGNDDDDSANATSPHDEPLVSSQVRSSSHSRLRAYEANRREAYVTKLTSSSLYWRSFRALIHSALEETKRAELIMKAMTAADATYGIHMKCIWENMIDEESGDAIVEERQRRKLLKLRGVELNDGELTSEVIMGTGGVKKGFRLHEKEKGGGGAGGNGAASASGALNGQQLGGNSGGSHLRGNASTPATASAAAAASGNTYERHGAMLRSLEDGCSILSDRFLEMSIVMEKQILPEFTSLREQLEDEVYVMEHLGDAILAELDCAERTVTEAWESYYDAADKALSGGGSSEADTNRARRRGASDANTTSIDDLLDDCRDVWAEEMRYRMAVAFLSSCWEKASAELSRLFTTMKETECSRRFRLRELLISSLQRKERLYLSLPSVLTPVLKDLVNRPMDTLSIEDDVQTSIRVRAQAIQREELTEKKRVEPGSGLLGVKTKDGQFELSSPLLSDLLCKAKVIEKKSSGMIAGWRTTLAIITADSFLHLFEIPNSFKVQSGTAPEVAFHALVPPVEVPSESAIKEGKYDKQLSKAGLGDGAAATGQLMIKIWNARLTPTISIVLANSTVAFQNRPGNSTFEITETYGAHGASKLFGKLSTRKYHFRALTTEDAIEWTTILKSQK